MIVRVRALLIAIAISFSATGVSADGNATQAITDYVAAHVRPWIADPVIIDAVMRQNEENAALSDAEIGKLDLEWEMQATALEQPIVKAMLARDVSRLLMEKKAASAGLITEIILMDARGMNVGLSDVTSDCWQGDEPKWRETFAKGREDLFIEAPEEKDESTQAMQVQASMTIVDPASGRAIGAITVGINLAAL